MRWPDRSGGCGPSRVRSRCNSYARRVTAPAERIAELRELVAHHFRLYHEQDAPEIPDGDYDLLVRELRELEAEFPELVDESSPSLAVGSPASATFEPVVHDVPMMSLDNAMDDAELRAWADRVAKGLDGASHRFVCELKFDGLMPKWMGRLIRVMNLRSGPYSKFCHGIDAWKRLPH